MAREKASHNRFDSISGERSEEKREDIQNTPELDIPFESFPFFDQSRPHRRG
jgi:hypothetical protein